MSGYKLDHGLNMDKQKVYEVLRRERDISEELDDEVERISPLASA